MTDISGFGYADDLAFTTYLVSEIGVAAVPGFELLSRSERWSAPGAVRLWQTRRDRWMKRQSA